MLTKHNTMKRTQKKAEKKILLCIFFGLFCLLIITRVPWWCVVSDACVAVAMQCAYLNIEKQIITTYIVHTHNRYTRTYIHSN